MNFKYPIIRPTLRAHIMGLIINIFLNKHLIRPLLGAHNVGLF